MTTELTESTPDPTRRHILPGLHNLRDVGGYPASGGTTRWGKLFRSDALHGIDDAGRAHLRGLGIGHVVDLRGADERRRQPSSLAGLPLRVHEVPVFDDAAPATQALHDLDLAWLYDHIVDDRPTALVDAIRVIGRAGDDEAVLVHCTAGKDRTGLVIAFALLAVGTDRDAVVADYAMTAENLAGEWAEAVLTAVRSAGTEPSSSLIELITASPASVLERLLDRVDRDHGSPRALLRRQGLGPAELDRLAAVLVS